MKVLFLDVDGVLNSQEWFSKPKTTVPGDGRIIAMELDPEPVATLLGVLVATDARVVLSSTWRIVPDYVVVLKRAGIPIDDMTPRLSGGNNHRGEEIEAWLQAHPEVERFAIVDDDPDAGSFHPDAFVQTTWKKGLEFHHGMKLITLLLGLNDAG